MQSFPPNTTNHSAKRLSLDSASKSENRANQSDLGPDISSGDDATFEALEFTNKKDGGTNDVDNVYLIFSLDRLELTEEYNAQYPNDYRDVLREREYEVEMRLAEEREREWAEERMEEEKKLSLLESAGAFGGKAPSFDHLIAPMVDESPLPEPSGSIIHEAPYRPLPISDTSISPSSTSVHTTAISPIPHATNSSTVAPDVATERPERKRSRWGAKAESVSASSLTTPPLATPTSMLTVPQTPASAASLAPTVFPPTKSTAPVMSRISARGVDNRPAWMTQAAVSAAIATQPPITATATATTAVSTVSASSTIQAVTSIQTISSPLSSAAPVVSDPMVYEKAAQFLPPGTSPKIVNMMLKWGYQPGKGLGKELSGITAPVVHEVKGKGRGVIRGGAPLVIQVHRDKAKRKKGSKLSAKERALQQFLAQYDQSSSGLPWSSLISSNPSAPDEDGQDSHWTSLSMDLDGAENLEGSPVLLLRNIIVPDSELDDLETAVIEKMQEYGTVASVHVFQCATMEVVVEVDESNHSDDDPATTAAPVPIGSESDGKKKRHVVSLPPGEMIRVFVEFSSVSEALRAKEAMHDHHWKEHSLRVDQFSLSRYRALDLGPSEDDLYRVLQDHHPQMSLKIE